MFDYFSGDSKVQDFVLLLLPARGARHAHGGDKGRTDGCQYVEINRKMDDLNPQYVPLQSVKNNRFFFLYWTRLKSLPELLIFKSLQWKQ